MTDLEITRLCAEAMGWEYHETFDRLGDPLSQWFTKDGRDMRRDDYNPLTDDAQAMALVKKFLLRVQFGTRPVWLEDYNPPHWLVAYAKHPEHGIYEIDARNLDLNRAICECVAKMQEKK